MPRKKSSAKPAPSVLVGWTTTQQRPYEETPAEFAARTGFPAAIALAELNPAAFYMLTHGDARDLARVALEGSGKPESVIRTQPGALLAALNRVSSDCGFLRALQRSFPPLTPAAPTAPEKKADHE